MSIPSAINLAAIDPRVRALAQKDSAAALLHAAEELAEASAACAALYRAVALKDGDADARAREVAEELADALIMIDQVLCVVPIARTLLPVVREEKIYRALFRYGIKPENSKD